MAGIFGIFRLDGGGVDGAEMASMADALEHRGPDGIETLNWGEVAMGHCALHTTPESLHEILPCRDSLAGLAITADARIDNRKQLASDLGIHAAETAALGDSQLILRAYGKWGEACVEHLLGDFAFAIWDENQRKLLLARDHAGCKPLYYHSGEGLLVFASSAKAVARVSGVGASLNEARIADYLTELLEGGDHTCSFYNEVSRLPPAHAASMLCSQPSSNRRSSYSGVRTAAPASMASAMRPHAAASKTRGSGPPSSSRRNAVATMPPVMLGIAGRCSDQPR